MDAQDSCYTRGQEGSARFVVSFFVLSFGRATSNTQRETVQVRDSNRHFKNETFVLMLIITSGARARLGGRITIIRLVGDGVRYVSPLFAFLNVLTATRFSDDIIRHDFSATFFRNPFSRGCEIRAPKITNMNYVFIHDNENSNSEAY